MHPAAAARLPAPPQRCFAGSRLAAARAAACLALAALCRAGAGARRRGDAELTTFDVIRDEDGVYLSYAVDFELSASGRGRARQGGAALLRRRGEVFRDRWYWRDRRVAARGAGLAHRLPAAHVDATACTFGGAEPDLSDPRARRSPRSAAARAGRSPSRARSTRAQPLRRVQLPARHRRCCRGRCRSASAGQPDWQLSREAHAAPELKRFSLRAPTPEPARMTKAHPLGLDRLGGGRHRRRARARVPARRSRPTTRASTSATTSGCSGSTWSSRRCCCW